ncbi:MAG: DUF927 domain-containing protein [Clostridia bacterium]|nr:DUF927 domain-containing protein [Clostridia bacterium]
MENEENPFKDLTKDQLLNREVIETPLHLTDIGSRERILAQLEARAKELKVFQNFKRMFKSIQAEIIQSKKQINSYETEFTRAPLKLKCKNYVCNDMGVTKTDFNTTLMQSVDTVVCTHPILPVERLINVDTNTEKVKLAFYKDKRWQNVIAEKNTLASKNKILQLANTGIEVNENNAKDLIIYISDLLSVNTEVIPYNKAITHLGWTEDGFVPYIKDYKFDGDRSFEGVFKDIKEKGDVSIWLNTLRELRKNEVVHFLIASSFASVLIEKVHINPFIVHLWGKSGTGKSVSLIIAMSIWGNPAIGHLVKNLNSTSVGLERLSAFLNNIPFAGDELQAIKNKYTDFNEMIYKLTQGEGKSRGTVDGGIAEQLKWNCAFLTTGEEPITSEYSKEGVKNRVIEIEENNPLFDNEKQNGNQICTTLFSNYGFGGKMFLDKLPTDEELQRRHSQIFQELDKKYKGTGKQTNAIAAIILADEIASKYIFEDETIKVDEVERYFSKDIDEAERIYKLIFNWFSENLNRFNGKDNVEQWGRYDSIEDRVTAIYINPKILKDFLNNNNINFNGIKNKLFEKGYLEKSSKNEFTQPHRINGILQRVMLINIKSETKNIDEMPF